MSACVEASTAAAAGTPSDDHYNAVGADSYETAYFYSPGVYQNWMAAMVASELQLQPHHSLADVGGGTGNFTVVLAEAVGLQLEAATVVDPSKAMIDAAAARSLDATHADAVAWAVADRPARRHDRVLLKEVVHHLNRPQRQQLFGALKERRLEEAGRLLIVMRPQRNIDYPFFEHAREVWAKQVPPEQSVVDDLEAAGFHNVRMVMHPYPCEVSRSKWLQMVAAKFWSTFSIMEDKAHEAGVMELTAATDGKAVLNFDDRLLFVTADVAPAPATAPATPLLPSFDDALGVRYARDGFVGPVDALSLQDLDEAAAGLAAYEEALHADGGALAGDARFKLHVLMPWAARLVSHPRVLDAVAAALGTRDLLVWSSDLNVKEAQSESLFTMHQDSTYMGLSPGDCVLTAWIALGPATEDMGCVRFVPCSHVLGQLPHTQGQGGSANMLSLGQAVAELDGRDWAAESVPVALAPGQVSLHAARCVHGSFPNTTDQRRVGLAVRYLAASTRHIHPPTSEGDKTMVTLVSGTAGDEALREFALEQMPGVFLGEAERAVHAEALQREKARYFGTTLVAPGTYK